AEFAESACEAENEAGQQRAGSKRHCDPAEYLPLIRALCTRSIFELSLYALEACAHRPISKREGDDDGGKDGGRPREDERTAEHRFIQPACPASSAECCEQDEADDGR